MTVKLRLKKTEYGEWIVAWYDNGVFNDAKSYYTDDKQDAIRTMDDMARRAGIEVVYQHPPRWVSRPVQDFTSGMYDPPWLEENPEEKIKYWNVLTHFYDESAAREMTEILRKEGYKIRLRRVFDGLFSRVWKLYEGSPGKYGAHLTVAEYRRTHPEQNPSPVYLQKKMRAEALIKDEQEGMETYSTLSGYYASTPAALQFYNMALDEERHRDAIREMSEQGFIENPEVPDELMDQFSRIYSSLSPENLTCDGELSRGQVRVKHAGLMRELRNLERQAGRSISEDEVCKWWLAKRGR